MNQACFYNKAVPRAKKLKEKLLSTMLQNVVPTIDNFCKVKTNADHEVAKGRAELMYKQYIILLLSAAFTFDTEKTPKSRRFLKEDLQVNIFYMGGYLQKEDMEYMDER